MNALRTKSASMRMVIACPQRWGMPSFRIAMAQGMPKRAATSVRACHATMRRKETTASGYQAEEDTIP